MWRLCRETRCSRSRCVSRATIETVLSDTQLLTIVLAQLPITLVILVGVLVNNAQLSKLRDHLDVRFKETKDHWRSQDLKRYRAL
jgi:hypothetical protein